LAAGFLKSRPWCPFLQFITSGRGEPAPTAKVWILVFWGREKGAFHGYTPPARRQAFVMEEFSFLSKQEVIINKELFANVCISNPILFLIVQCMCTGAFFWCRKLLQMSDWKSSFILGSWDLKIALELSASAFLLQSS
jgi:hypothetical protein